MKTTVTLYGVTNDAESKVVGVITLEDGQLTGDTKEAQNVLTWPLQIGSDEIDAKKEPERFLRSMYLGYKTIYLTAGKADG